MNQPLRGLFSRRPQSLPTPLDRYPWRLPLKLFTTTNVEKGVGSSSVPRLLTYAAEGTAAEHHLPSPRHALQRHWNQTTLAVVTSGGVPSKTLRFQPSHSTSSSSDQARPREQLGCVRHVMTVLYTYLRAAQATPPQECENVRMRTCRAGPLARATGLGIKYQI